MANKNGNGEKPKLKILIVSHEALASDLAWQLVKEGHDVKFSISDKDSKDIADGFVTKVDDWHEAVDWADLVIFDDCLGFGKEAEKLRKDGKLVVGGTSYTDRLEDEREFGQDEMKAAGINILPHWDFTDFDEAIKFVKENPRRYVLKPCGKVANEKELLFVGAEEDGIDVLQVLEHYKKYWAKKMLSFQIQKFVSGVEVAVGAYFNGKKFITPVNVNFEHKKLFPGEKGPSTGEMGTSMYWCEPNALFKATLEKMTPKLVECGYVGYIDIGCIVNNNGVYPLEFTCFDDETEILTRTGWKLFKDIMVNEEVATMNPETEEIEFQKVRGVIHKFHNGNMIRFGSRKSHTALDALVTPDHQMFVRDRKGRKIFVRADRVAQGSKIVRAAKWSGMAAKTFVLPGYTEQHVLGRHKKKFPIEHPPVKIPMDDWLKFLALYLAEGSNNGYIVGISQLIKSKAVGDVLSRLPFKYPKTRHGFQICSRQLTMYLAQFGTSAEKYVPDYVKGLSPRQIMLFLDAYLLGDGSIHKRTKQRSYYTVSRRMADDLQELLLKCGIVANIYTRKVKGTKMTVGGKVYMRKHDGYSISERHVKKDYYVDKRSMSVVGRYSSMVHCVEVPNHTLLVRRKGRPFFAGNCRFGYPTINIHMEGVLSPWGEFFYALAKGEDYQLRVRSGFQVGVVIAVPPFPFEDPNTYRKFSEDATIIFKKEVYDGVHIGDVKLVNGDWLVTGGVGYVLIITGSGSTMEDARDMAYKRINNILIPNMFYRTDIGERWQTDSGRLQTWGYLP